MVRTKLNVSEAKDRLSQLDKDAAETTEPIMIAVHGRNQVVMISQEEYESLMETIEILRDQDLVKKILASLKELKRGEVVDFDSIKKVV